MSRDLALRALRTAQQLTVDLQNLINYWEEPDLESESSASSQSSSKSSASSQSSSQSSSSSTRITPVPTPTLEAPYPGFTPIGLGVDKTTRRTVFPTANANEILSVGDSNGLAQAVQRAKSDLTIKRIRCTTTTPFAVPQGLFGGINRPAHNPLVIEGTAGTLTPLTVGLHHDKHRFSGLALLNFSLGGISILADNQDLLIECCTLWSNIQGLRNADETAPQARNIQIRFCTARDHWTPTASALCHGLFAYNVDHHLIQHCWLHHNGWTGTRATPSNQGGAIVRNHNVYVEKRMTNFVFDQNVSSEPSSHGITAKSGGHITNNVFINCPIGFQPGYAGDGIFERQGYATAVVKGNVAFGSEDINTTEGNLRGVFGWLECLQNSVVEDNIACVNATSSANDAVFWIPRKVTHGPNVQVRNNRAYGWAGGIFFAPGTFSTAGYNFQNNQLDLQPSVALRGEATRISHLVNYPSLWAEIQGSQRVGADPQWVASKLSMARSG